MPAGDVFHGEPGLRLPPHSMEAEQSLIGAVLIDNRAFDRVGDVVSAGDFYRDDHRRIWGHIATLIEANKPADIVTVSEALEAGEDHGKTKGAAYLAALAQNTPSALNVRRYAEIVAEKAAFRAIAARAGEIAERALAAQGDPQDLAEDAAGAFLSIQKSVDGGDFVPFGQAVVEAVEIADNPKLGLSTGLLELDRRLAGMKDGDLIVVAARPSMGKTAIAMQVAEHVSVKDQVAILSIEMTRQKVAGRALRYHEANLGRAQALDHLSALKLHIDDSSTVSIQRARARLRRLKQKHGLKLIVVDYLQLVDAPDKENRTQEVSAISRGLKAIAKDLGVPVIAVSQLSRKVEERTDKRPMMADLRESGQIEQDADVVIFLYRDDYYHPDTEWRGITEAIIAKNRDGGIGKVYLEWVPEFTRFKTLERALPNPVEPAPRGGFSNYRDPSGDQR